MPRQPLQAQLHVMRNSFNRVTRPESENSSFPPNHPAAASSSFMPSGFPPQGQDHHRGFVLPNQDSGNPRVGSARNFQHRPLVPISSSTLSSLPQSVAAYYEHEQRQHQQPQASSQEVGLSHSGLSFTHQLPQHVAQHHSTAPMPQTDPSLGQYPYSSGVSRGTASRSVNHLVQATAVCKTHVMHQWHGTCLHSQACCCMGLHAQALHCAVSCNCQVM